MIERLEAGEHETPPVPHTRAPSREERAGAPLWLLVDFRSSVPPTTGRDRGRTGGVGDPRRLGDPDGELLAPGTEDVLLTAPMREHRGGRACTTCSTPRSATPRGVQRGRVAGSPRSRWRRTTAGLGHAGGRVSQRRSARLLAQAGGGVHRSRRPRGGAARTAGRAARPRHRRSDARAGRAISERLERPPLRSWRTSCGAANRRGPARRAQRARRPGRRAGAARRAL